MLIARLIFVLLMLAAGRPSLAQATDKAPVAALGLSATASLATAATDSARSASPVLVEFFYTTGCDECREIEDEVLPLLQELMGTSMDLRKYDILNPANYLRLAALQDKSGVRTTEHVSIYVDERIHMGGLKTIKAQLIPTVEAVSLARTEARHRTTEQRSKRPTSNIQHRTSNEEGALDTGRRRADDGYQTTDTGLPTDVSPVALAKGEALAKQGDPQSEISPQPTAYGLKSIAPGENVMHKRLDTMTVAAVAAAGLIDGLNPCAFATLIFFITLLSVTGKRGRELIAVGIGFCTAVFITYFLLGFGVFHVIQKLTAFHRSGEVLRWVMVAGLAGLCILSFKDALAFGKTGQAHAVSLQLPGTIRKRIHGIMRSRLTARRLFLGSFTIGGLVTLLESICTGQFYVPTLVYMSRQAAAGRQALGLLTLYNVMFVIPHVVVFAAAYRGVTNERLLAWSRAHTVWSKVLLGLGFAALAGLMVWL